MGNTDFVNLLTYLEQSRSITQEESNRLKSEIVTNDGLKLSGLLALFADVNWAGDLLLSLPLTPNGTPGPAGSAFTNLIANEFSSSHGEALNGWKGIESVSFKVEPPQGSTFTWIFPFGTSSPSRSRSYQFTHDGVIDISIEWPAYSERAVQGSYRGVLHVGVDKYPIVGKFLKASDAAPLYSMTFSNESYDVDSYRVPISVPLSLFDATDFSFPEELKQMDIAGLTSTVKNLDKSVALKDVGFVLEKTLSEVLVKEVSGTLPLSSGPNSDWWPFKKTSFSIDSLRIVLRGIDAALSREVIVQLNGNVNEFNPAVPFRLSAGLSGKDTEFEIAILPDFNSGGLSIQQILDVSNMSSILDVGKSFPSISDLSNSFLITTARLGWGKKGIKLVRLGIDIKEWNVLPGKFLITDLSCDIYATLPAESKQFSLWGSGAIQIGNIDLQILYSIVGKQHVTFQLQTSESPLTLKSIFGHFLGDSGAVLPEGLVSVLEETGIESLIVEGSHDGSGWSLSRFALAVGISTQVKLSDKFQLLYPRLAVDVAYPFTKAKRKIDATIGATIVIAETPCDTLVTWEGASSNLTVAFQPRGEPLLLGALVSLFVPDANTSLSIPPSLEFLIGIGLADAKLVLSSSKDGFKLSEVSALVVSSTSLQLWDGLELSGLKLYFHYSSIPGNETKAVTFGATFLIAKANLDFTISYNGPGSKSISPQSSPTKEPDDKVAASNSGTWAATTTYTGTISVLNIMSSISGIDISSELSSIGLPALRDLMDISLSDLKLALARASDETSFTFDARVKYLFFDGPVHLTCSKSTTWEYSFAFGLSSEEFLSSLGIDGISLINSSISLSNAPVTGNLLVNTVSNNGLNLAFTGTLVFTGQLKQLANVTGNPSLTITGSVSSKSIMLAAAASKIPLFNGMSLTGTLFFSYSTDSKLLTAAIDGTVSDIYFPEVSSEKFSASCSLFVKLPNPEVGFQFALDKLENAFGVKGLHFKDILLRAAFQEFPVPSEVLVAGKLSFRAGNQQFYGSVAIYYSEVDVSHCGTMGKFETYPSLNQALKGFDSAGRTAPKAVNGTFADLEFSRALQEVRVGNIVIPQGFIMKGSLKLPSIGLDMWFDIEFTPAHIRIAGDIKNAITITVNNNRLFALTRANDQNRGPTMDLTIDTHSPPKCYSSGEIYLLGLSASAQFEMTDSGIEFHETISAWMSGFKIDFAINYTYYLDLAATCILNLDIPSFKCGVVTIPRMDAVKFSASLATKVYWEPITWNLSIAGTMNLGKWNLGEIGPFNLGADLSDFGKVANYLVNQIKDGIAALISDKVLGGLKKGLKVAVDELKAAGLLAKNTAELLVKEFKQDIDEVTKQVGEVFDLGKEEMAKIMKELGSTAEQIGRFFKDTYSVAAKNITQILKQVGYAVEDVGRTLKNVYGIAANEVSDILKQAGYAADDVGRTLKDVYGVASKEVATLLKQAGYAVDDVGRALKDVFGATETEVADLLKQAGYAVDDVGKALKDVFGATESQVTSILKQIGYSADDVGRALKDVYGASSKEVGSLLKGAGYALDDVTRTLQNVFSVSAESAASILRDIGYAADDVAKTLKNVFDVTGQQASQMLQAAGYAMQDVNKAIGDIFGDIGNTIGDIGNTIGDIGNTIGGIGNIIGGGANDIGGAIGDLGNTIGGGVKDVGDKIGDGLKDAGKTIGGIFGF